MFLPKSQWAETNALVYSVDFHECRGEGDDFDHYTVVYSYKVGEERYSGSFRDYINAQDGYFKRDDVITVRYDPGHPQKSFFGEAASAWPKRLIFLGIGGALAILVLLSIH